jgi:hypothetical protein
LDGESADGAAIVTVIEVGTDAEAMTEPAAVGAVITNCGDARMVVVPDALSVAEPEPSLKCCVKISLL